MTRSIHDNLLVSYQVECEARTITLNTQHRSPEKTTEFTDVVFKGVEAYDFENDAFGNVVFDLECVSVEQLLAERGAKVAESYRVAGSPGPWAANLRTAPDILNKKGVKGFILSSSYGLSGWVLAQEVSIVPAQHVAPPDAANSAARVS